MAAVFLQFAENFLKLLSLGDENIEIKEKILETNSTTMPVKRKVLFIIPVGKVVSDFSVASVLSTTNTLVLLTGLKHSDRMENLFRYKGAKFFLRKRKLNVRT